MHRGSSFYGWEKFQKEILCENLIRSGAENLEKWFIDYYDSSNPEKGYNRFLGGLGKGTKMCEITKEICRESKKRQYEEHPEIKEKIRNTVKALFANDPSYRERIRQGMLAAYAKDPSMRIRNSERAKKFWQDPAYREKQRQGRYYASRGSCGSSGDFSDSLMPARLAR